MISKARRVDKPCLFCKCRGGHSDVKVEDAKLRCESQGMAPKRKVEEDSGYAGFDSSDSFDLEVFVAACFEPA